MTCIDLGTLPAPIVACPSHTRPSAAAPCYPDLLVILVVDHEPEVLEKAQEILNRDRQVFLASKVSRA